MNSEKTKSQIELITNFISDPVLFDENLKNFLFGFRFYLSKEELIGIIIQICEEKNKLINNDNNHQVYKCVIKFCEEWLQISRKDFLDQDFLQQFQLLIINIIPQSKERDDLQLLFYQKIESILGTSSKKSQLISTQTSNQSSSSNSSSIPPNQTNSNILQLPTISIFSSIFPSLGQNQDSSSSPILVLLSKYSIHEIAKQLTILEQERYLEVELWEWGNETPGGGVTIFNGTWVAKITKLVTSSIILPQSPETRAQVYEAFVSLADECLKQQNFLATVEICNAIQVASISRLKSTLSLVNKRTHEKLDILKVITSVEGRYKELRNLMSIAPLPALPYPSIFAKELIHLTNALKTFTFQNLSSLSRPLKDLERFQTILFEIEPIHEIQEFFISPPLPRCNHESLFQLSLEREPKAG